MIEKLTLDPMFSKLETYSLYGQTIYPNRMQDAFYYTQDVPVNIKKIFRKSEMAVEILKFIVIRYKTDDQNIVILNDKDLYKKLLNAMIVSNNLRNTIKQECDDYEMKCYNLYHDFSRIPRWITDESRVIVTTFDVEYLRGVIIGDINIATNELVRNCTDDDLCNVISDKSADSNTSDSDSLKDEEERVDIGIETVDYALKWLEPKGIINVPKDCIWKNTKCIRLNNPAYVDDPQEFDHIVIISNCVIMIETKNYKGKISIDQYGNWSRTINGNEKGLRNPKQQIDRHVDLLRSILPNNIIVIGVLCLSHPEVLISGAENTDVTIVRSDLLGDYIMTMQEKYGDIIDIVDDKIKILNVINSYKISDKVEIK